MVEARTYKFIGEIETIFQIDVGGRRYTVGRNGLFNNVADHHVGNDRNCPVHGEETLSEGGDKEGNDD